MRGRRRRPTGPSLNQQVESFHGEEYVVRRVSGSSAAKEYRCPGCDQVIRPATPHVVAWPVQAPMFVASGLDARRHWHTACWQARERRR